MEYNKPVPVPAEPPAPISRYEFADEDYVEAPAGPGLKRYIRALLRHKWLIILFAIMGTAAAWYGGRFLTPTYTAQGTLWLQTVDRQTNTEGPIRSAQLLQDNAWVELLRSLPVLEPVVREQRLYLEHSAADSAVLANLTIDSIVMPGQYRLRVAAQGAEVELRGRDDAVVDRVPTGNPVGGAVGILWTPPASELRPGQEVSFTVLAPSTAAYRLAADLRVSMPMRSNFLSVSWDDASPERAAAVINAITHSYVRVATDLKRVHLVEMRKDLSEQLTYARANLEAAEFELNEFLVRTATMPTQPAMPIAPGTQETRSQAMSNYFSLRVERDQLERDRDAIERAMASGQISVDALNFVESVQRSPELLQALAALTEKRAEIRTLLERLTVDHPQVVRARQEQANLESSVIPQLAGNLLGELRNQLAVMDRMLGSAAGELQDIPPRVIAEARYRRAATSAETLHNNLLQRYENARLAAETTQPDVSILTAAAVPQMPTRDMRMRVLLMGLVGGLGLGVGLAVLLDFVDRRLRYADQVSEELGLTVLGAIPDLSVRRMFRSRPEKAELIEALRGVRLNVMHAHGAAGPLMVTLTSPGPGDGKTFLTTSLGTAFADLGMRVLVIDGDLRRGTVHRVYEMNRKPGLSDYLNRAAELGDVIRQGPSPKLHVIGSGTRLPNAPDLLSSPRMSSLLAHVRANYDVVLLDSPPLGAGVDPLILATLTGSVLLIMRPGRTDKKVAEAKLAMLNRLPTRVLGAVLNGIENDAPYKYYSYLPGYESGEFDADDPKPKRLQPA